MIFITPILNWEIMFMWETMLVSLHLLLRSTLETMSCLDLMLLLGGSHRIDLVGRYMDSVKESEKLPENDQDVWIDDVWVGCNVTILKGVHIGRGSVIGAGSVVAKNVSPYSIYIGNHPVSIKRRFSDEEINEHELLLKQYAEL